MVPSGSLAVFTADDSAAAAASATKPDPVQQVQATIAQLQEQIQQMAKVQEAMARHLVDNLPDQQDASKAAAGQAQSESEATSAVKSDTAESSSKSWLPSMPSILRSS